MFNLLVRESTCPQGPACSGANNVPCLAKGAVEHAICTACQLLKTDPGGYYLYKRPLLGRERSSTLSHRSGDISGSYTTGSSSPTPLSSDTLGTLSDDGTDNSSLTNATLRSLRDRMEWPTIDEFTLSEALNQIRDFIALWRLTPATMCELILPPTVHEPAPPLGCCYFVDAHFSKPSPMCPNPLAVAKVHFRMHVSDILPKDYPIMITYRFEGFDSVFYALGERCVHSMRFQRLYIDTIIRMKLAFYAEVCELRHPPMRQSKQSVDDPWPKSHSIMPRSNESFADFAE